MNLMRFSLLNFGIFLSLQVNAMPDLLRLDEDRIVYWQEKKLGRTLSEYEKQQLLNSYILKSGKPRAEIINLPLDTIKPNLKHRMQFVQKSVVDTLEKVKILGILVDFPDLQASSPGLETTDTDMFYDDYSADHYRSLLYSVNGFSGPNGENLTSVRQFYRNVTGDNFDITGSIYGWVRVSNDASYYGEQDGDIRDKNATELVIEAVENLVKQGVDLSDYDLTDLNDIDGDGIINEPDGIIDHILLFHSSIGQEAGGGLLGEDAIWSHRFFVTNSSNQPASVTGSNIKAYNYTINPIDAGIGVVVHEFGHDLGLPDEYDLKNIEIGEPVANWSVMSSGSWMGEIRGSEPVMFSPKNLDYLQNRFGGSWVNQQSVELSTINENETINLAHASVFSEATNQVKVNLPPTLEDFIVPNSGSFQYYSGDGNNLNNQMSFTIKLPESEQLILRMKSKFNIESDYDIFQVYVNSIPLAGNSTKANHPNYPNVTHYLDGSSASSDVENSDFVDLTYDISAFSNQQVTITFVYQTDSAVSFFGIVLDDINVTSEDQIFLTDNAENTNSNSFNGFRKIGRYKSGNEHAYYLQLRSHNGLDSGLKLSQYPAGLTLWYSNDNYENNNTSEHQGFGDLLIVDTDQRPIFKSNGDDVANSMIQVRDAALRLSEQSSGLGDEDLSAISVFDDSLDYSFKVQPESGVKIPKYGLKIELVDVSDSFDNAEVLVSYIPDQTSISYEVEDKQVQFFADGFLLSESDQFLWEFSDGQSSDELTPTIEFEKYQNYSVKFTQKKENGQIITADAEINLSKPLEISEIDLAHASGILTGEVKIIGGVEPYLITWDFDDGNTLNGSEISHRYSMNGTYTVKVEVTDDSGISISKSEQVTLTVPLLITTSFTTNGLQLSANAISSGGSGNYNITWDFGDGNQGNGENVTHTFNSSGQFNISVTLTDTDTNKTKTETNTLTITQAENENSNSGGSLFFLLFSCIFMARKFKL
ncbi:immune inhibitor A domain-containing protein [Pseudoalteromonas phenolica]|nr:immune inhibitor A domain-containing protein [Pseudoalteromonas phenolica]MBE0357680.1 immune inhibitor A [Pseudoalteromonas phenolica O-BC30]